MATDLYKRTMARSEGDPDQGALMREVWAPTPWMVDVFIGSGGDYRREREMVEWCSERFGREGSPLHKIAGDWRRGNAIIHGWTWFGFATEQQMQQFLEAWPSPAPPQ